MRHHTVLLVTKLRIRRFTSRSFLKPGGTALRVSTTTSSRKTCRPSQPLHTVYLMVVGRTPGWVDKFNLATAAQMGRRDARNHTSATGRLCSIKLDMALRS